MSGGRFVLSILAVIVAYFLGVYVLSNWNSLELWPGKPSTESGKRVATKISEDIETKQRKTKSEPDASREIEFEKPSKLTNSNPRKKLSSSPVQNLEKKRIDEQAVTDNVSLPDKAAHRDIKPDTSKIVPSFDVVRVVPTGEAVIAGRSEPGWNVSIKAGQKLIGEAKADRDGQWVIISYDALEPGEHELELQSVAPEGKGSIVSNQKVLVAIEKSKTAKPKIVLAEAGKPERIVQPAEPDLPGVLEKTTISPNADKNKEDRKQKRVAFSSVKSSTQSDEGSSTIREIETSKGKSDTEAIQDIKKTVTVERKSELNEAIRDDIKTAENSDRTKEVESDKNNESELSSDIAKADRETQDEIASGDLKKSPSKAVDSVEVGSSVDPDKKVRTAQQKFEDVNPDKSADLVNDIADKNKNSDGDVVDSISGKQKNGKGSESLSAGKVPKSVIKPIPVPLVSVRSVEYKRSVENSGFLSLEGEGLPGARVNIFLNDEQIGTTKANSMGIWSFYKSVVIKPGQYMIQAKQVDQSGKTLALASKSFERVLPKAINIGSAKSSPDKIEEEKKAVVIKKSESNGNDRKIIASETKRPVSTSKSDKEQVNTRVAVRSADASKTSSRSDEVGQGQSEQSSQEKTSSLATKEPIAATEKDTLENSKSKSSGKIVLEQNPVDKNNINIVVGNERTGEQKEKEVVSNKSEFPKEVQKKIAAVENSDQLTQMKVIESAGQKAKRSEIDKDQKKKIAAVENINKPSTSESHNKTPKKNVSGSVGARIKKARAATKKRKRRKATSKSSRNSRAARSYKSRTRRHLKRRRKLSLSRSRLIRQKHLARIRRHRMKSSSRRAQKRNTLSTRRYQKRNQLQSHCTR